MTNNELQRIIDDNGVRHACRAYLDRGDVVPDELFDKYLETAAPEDDVTTLLGPVAERGRTIEEQAQEIASLKNDLERTIDALSDAHEGQLVLLRQCDERLSAATAASNLADHQAGVLRDVRQWLSDHRWSIEGPAQAALRQILGEDGDAP